MLLLRDVFDLSFAEGWPRSSGAPRSPAVSSRCGPAGACARNGPGSTPPAPRSRTCRRGSSPPLARATSTAWSRCWPRTPSSSVRRRLAARSRARPHRAGGGGADGVGRRTPSGRARRRAGTHLGRQPARGADRRSRRGPGRSLVTGRRPRRGPCGARGGQPRQARPPRPGADRLGEHEPAGRAVVRTAAPAGRCPGRRPGSARSWPRCRRSARAACGAGRGRRRRRAS